MADFPFEGSLMQHHPASFLTPLSACLLAPWPLGWGRQGFKGFLPSGLAKKGKGIKVPWTDVFFSQTTPPVLHSGHSGLAPSG